MIQDMLNYYKLLRNNDVTLVYSGPIWADGVEGIGQTLKKQMEFDALPLSAAQSVFSVFVEEMNNMLMYSSDKECPCAADVNMHDNSKGIFILSVRDKKYFAQSGNIVKNKNIGQIKSRIDHLNTLDKQELRKFYKEQIRNGEPGPESRGAGLGLIEIARRASSKIEYEVTPVDEESSFFAMCVAIG